MSQTFRYFTPVKVRYNDTDRQGHVYFGQYYEYFDEGVDAYLQEIGYGYEDMFKDDSDIVYAESHCNYKSSAKWPEILRVYTRIGHIGNRSLRFDFEIRAESDDRLVTTGHMVTVTVNRQTFTPHPVPPKLRQAVATYEETDEFLVAKK